MEALLPDCGSSIAAERARERFSGRGKLQTQQNSWQAEECLNPVRGLRDWQQRNGITPHDHHRNNLAAIRAQSRANSSGRLKATEQAQRAQPPFTPKINTSKASTPLPRQAAKNAGCKDYVYGNALATHIASVSARDRRHVDKEDEGLKWLSRRDFGQVPAYLQARKLRLIQQHEQEQEKHLSDLMPPGMRVLPESERLEMLEILTSGKATAEREIRALPFVIETASQKQRASALHTRLEEMEEALDLFSRDVVFVEL